ncbi:MAG: hypothetical protein WCJ62_08410 [Flavobacterium sp.]
MRNFTIYLALSLCLLASKLVAQNQDPKVESTTQTFEAKVKAIGDKIEKITAEEKAFLKIEVEKVNLLVEKGTITQEQAEDKKKTLANASASTIESRIAAAQEELKELVQAKVDGKLAEYSKKHEFSFKWTSRKDSIQKSENRTTSISVLAFGANNLVTNGAIANSDFKYIGSSFFEWGISLNTRISKSNNLLHFKYGLTGVYNELKPTENRYFIDNNGQTTLSTVPFSSNTKDTRFKNVFITIPLFLEFDFSGNKIDKNGNKIFRIERGYRFGLGGFIGYNTNSKQFITYEENGYRIDVRQKGNWNIPDWNYGISAYVGYKHKSVYVKYDLNPMFKNNTVKQNNISLGVRFDWN